MKINYVLKEDGTIESWTSYPFDESKPYITVKDPSTIHLGIDKVVDGKLVRDKEKYQNTLEIEEKHRRILVFKKKLADSDYLLFKYLEGELSKEEYEQIKIQRQSYREQINKLEEEIK